MKITYWGGGYVGLTGAVHFAQAGQRTIIYDPDPTVVAAINAGAPKASEFLSYLNTPISSLVEKGALRATTDLDVAYLADAHILAVPTERDGEPCSQIVIDAVADIHKNAPRPTTILIESTMTPGTTLEILERTRKDDLGEHWFLAVCPRRDWFADRAKNLATLPRVVGGVTPACTTRAIEVLSIVSPAILATEASTAELTKALENALLHVPVMMVHQLAAALPDHNVAEALKLAATHWRFTSMQPLHLGAGCGGRCVPLGTRYLSVLAGREYTIGREAIIFDAEMRMLVAQAVIRRVSPEARICVLGIAYRPDFRDAGLSPGLDVVRAIRHRAPRLSVTVHDPMWTAPEVKALFDMTPGRIDEADVLVLVTPHTAYAELPEKLHDKRLIFDAQGTWAKYKPTFASRGIQYVQLGTPGWR